MALGRSGPDRTSSDLDAGLGRVAPLSIGDDDVSIKVDGHLISVRLGRRWTLLSLGNPGDVKPVGSGVSEMRIDIGPGYRVYYMRSAERIYLILAGGDKSTQSKDIRRAIKIASALKAADPKKRKSRKPK